MTVLTVEQAKPRLEEVLGEVVLGNELVLVLQNGQRVRILPEGQSGRPDRTPGALAGRLVVGPEFFDSLSEEELHGL